jgi:hypothetical protein
MKVGKANAPHVQRIECRRSDVFTAKRTEICKPQVISNNDQEVRTL